MQQEENIHCTSLKIQATPIILNTDIIELMNLVLLLKHKIYRLMIDNKPFYSEYRTVGFSKKSNKSTIDFSSKWIRLRYVNRIPGYGNVEQIEYIST